MKPAAVALTLTLTLLGAHAGESSFVLIDASRCLHLRLHTDIDILGPKYSKFAEVAERLQQEGKSGYFVLGVYDEVKRDGAAGLALCRYEYSKKSATPTDQPDGFSCTSESHPAVASLVFRAFGRYGAFASAFACSENCPSKLNPSLYDTSSQDADHRVQIREDLSAMRKACKPKRKA